MKRWRALLLLSLAAGAFLISNTGCPPAMVSVPSVVGQTQSEAEVALAGAGLVAGNVTEANSISVSVGDVVHQDPIAGALAAIDSPVNLVISAGPPDTETIMLPGDVPLVLVKVLGSTFMMGRSPEEQDGEVNEAPQHQVTLTNDYWIGAYEVTQAQWTAVMKTTPWFGQLYSLYNANAPVVYVSWNDAQDFVAALNTHIEDTDQGEATMRLPTEAEWECAARAGTVTRFYWGDDPGYSQIGDYAWYEGNAGSVGQEYAHYVGQKLPNDLGLYDMSGNVYELCQDWFGTFTAGDVTDPSGPATGTSRVARGGCWGIDARYCRSAIRNGRDPDDAYYSLGFRVGRE